MGLSPSKPPSLTENFPARPRHDTGEDLFRFCGGGGLVGKFWVWTGGANSLHGAASHSFSERGVRINLHLRKTYTLPTHLACQKSAKPHSAKNLHLPNHKKLPPRAPAPSKAKQIFAVYKRVLLGEVRGGLEGEGTPSERGSLLPPRSSSPVSDKTRENRCGIRRCSCD